MHLMRFFLTRKVVNVFKYSNYVCDAFACTNNSSTLQIEFGREKNVNVNFKM